MTTIAMLGSEEQQAQYLPRMATCEILGAFALTEPNHGSEIEKRLAAIGKKVQMVVNYDNFYLAPDLTDAYVTLVRRLGEPYYAAVTRYTTSSFMRLKLSEQLSKRGLAPHIYESRQEAMNWNKK